LLRATSIIRASAALFILALVVASAHAQDSARSGRLYDELAKMDRELFEAAFVTCDQVKFSSVFVDDPEFYHDRTGATYGEDVKRLQSCPRDNGVKRTLVADSLEVYPLKDYGAIQIGRHTFTRAGEPGVEIAKFVHLWRYIDGQWRLARVLSFDHRPMTELDENTATDVQP
jgi:Domain of unknown function (DUF4440)